jgi:hypothetical protein
VANDITEAMEMLICWFSINIKIREQTQTDVQSPESRAKNSFARLHLQRVILQEPSGYVGKEKNIVVLQHSSCHVSRPNDYRLHLSVKSSAENKSLVLKEPDETSPR